MKRRSTRMYVLRLARAVLLTLVLLGGAMPARAADVTVTLSFRLLTDFGNREPVGPGCDVTVRQGANGYAVLDAAVAKGCIVSWRYAGSHGVRCINEVCELLGRCSLVPVLGLGTVWSATAPGGNFYSFSASDGSHLRTIYGLGGGLCPLSQGRQS